MDEPVTISKQTYDRRVFWLRLPILAVVVVASYLLRARIGRHAMLVVASVAAAVLARALVDRDLRRRGLTPPGTPIVVEVRARSPFGGVADVGPGEAVEAFPPAGMRRVALVVLPAAAVGAVLLARSFEIVEAWWFYMGVAAFFTVLWLAVVSTHGKPQARVDADGVTGHASAWGLGRRFVAWSDVFSCEFQTCRDASGKPVLPRPILKERHGETLMELDLSDLPTDARERISLAIKARLPETEVEPRPT